MKTPIIRRVSILAMVLLFAGLGTAERSAAQHVPGQVELTPFVGVYIPLGEVLESGAISSDSPAASHEVDLMLGGKLTYWMKQEWGIELEVLFAPNALESDAVGVPGTTDATFLNVSGRLVYDFGKDADRPSFLLTGGLGVFTTSYDDPLDMTAGGMGIVGLGLRVPLGNAIALRVDLSDYISTTRWRLGEDAGKTDKFLQNDLTLTGGLSIVF